MAWAMTQNSLGIALQALGERLGGEVGASLLGEAVDALSRGAAGVDRERRIQWTGR